MTRRVAVTGAGGQLGRQLVAAFERAGDEVLALRRPDFDITRATDLERLSSWSPQIVINSAAWTDVDGCARDPERAMRINGESAGEVAAAARRANALVVQISTNEVFDGTGELPYREAATPAPINAYGASKLAGERAVMDATPRHLVVRTAWLFGPAGSNFVTKILAAAQRLGERGEPLRVVDDEWGNPTWTPQLAEAIVRAVEAAPDTGANILHLAGTPASTRFDWAATTLAELADASSRVERIASADYPRASTVPLHALLDDGLARSLGIGPLEWKDATADYARRLAQAGAHA